VPLRFPPPQLTLRRSLSMGSPHLTSMFCAHALSKGGKVALVLVDDGADPISTVPAPLLKLKFKDLAAMASAFAFACAQVEGLESKQKET